jgi:hypothetical protein
MTVLKSSTINRLKKIAQSNSVWEGDRRSLPRAHKEREDGSNLIHLADHTQEDKPQCILWVDGSMGYVRSMEVVDPNMGQEAMVQALLQAIEYPQSPSQPNRPQKILVRDRSLQFYLRGVLQGLDITVEHIDHLPMIDEVFQNLLQHTQTTPPTVPPNQAEALYQQADTLWRTAPWEYMWDHQVLQIEINQWDMDTVYAVVMGHLGLERGVIFYRSRASLVQFRQLIAENDSEDLEETFLRQDCIFTLFESNESLSESEIRAIRNKGWSIDDDIHPIFGILHPLEGGRPFLYEDEAIALTVAMQSLNMFVSSHKTELESGEYGVIKSTYKIKPPHKSSKECKVVVQTVPDLEEEIQEIIGDDDDLDTIIHDDLLPDNTLVKLLGISWEGLEFWREHIPKSSCYLSQAFPQTADAFSVLLIQTSRPKALDLIAEIKFLGNIQGVCFHPAEDNSDPKELGLLIMGNEELHLFGEFSQDDYSPDQEMRQRWLKRCQESNGICGVIVAMGLTGVTKGRPSTKHILAFYEVPLINPDDLGLDILKSSPSFEF